MPRQKIAHRWTFVPLLILLALGAALLPGLIVRAAYYRNWIAQVPPVPTSSDTVRVWMNSDTVLGETAGLEYNIGSSYVKVLGTYDTSYAGATGALTSRRSPRGHSSATSFSRATRRARTTGSQASTGVIPSAAVRALSP